MSTTDLSATPGTPPVRPARHRPHRLLGGLLVKEGLINRVQLDRVLRLQDEIEPRPLLGQLLVEEKLITPHELDVVLGKYHKVERLGNVLVEMRVITPAQLETALAHQRKTDGLLGEILIQLGLITERQLKQALCVQLKLTFVDLDEWRLDPTLSAVISERYARHHRVLPVGRIDDGIVLAMEDPTDAGLVAELRSCTGQRIEVVVVTASALDRAFARRFGGGQDGRAEPTPNPVPAPAPDEAVTSEPEAAHGNVGERAALDRLGADLHESQAAHAATSRELEAKTRALAKLEIAHAAVIEERDLLNQSLAELRQRHEALLRDRALTVDQLDAILYRVRP